MQGEECWSPAWSTTLTNRLNICNHLNTPEVINHFIYAITLTNGLNWPCSFVEKRYASVSWILLLGGRYPCFGKKLMMLIQLGWFWMSENVCYPLFIMWTINLQAMSMACSLWVACCRKGFHMNTNAWSDDQIFILVWPLLYMLPCLVFRWMCYFTMELILILLVLVLIAIYIYIYIYMLPYCSMINYEF